MISKLCACSRIVLVAILTIALAPHPTATAQTVTPAELRDALRKASAEKQGNLSQVQTFFATSQVRDALAKSGVDSNRVQKAVSTLNADELSKLAARTSKIQSDLAAGALNNQDLTYIVIALAAAVLVLVVVAAH